MDKHKDIILIDHSCFLLHTLDWMPAESARGLHDKRANIRDQKPRFRCRSADKSLARPGRKQATATEDFVVHISGL